MITFLIIAAIAALITSCCGGVAGFKKIYVWGFLGTLLFFATIIVARHDDQLLQQFYFDGGDLALVLGSLFAGCLAGIVISVAVSWFVEEFHRRTLYRQSYRPPYAVKHPSTQTRSSHRRTLPFDEQGSIVPHYHLGRHLDTNV